MKTVTCTKQEFLSTFNQHLDTDTKEMIDNIKEIPCPFIVDIRPFKRKIPEYDKPFNYVMYSEPFSKDWCIFEEELLQFCPLSDEDFVFLRLTNWVDFKLIVTE